MSALIHIRSYRSDETGGDLCWDATCVAHVTDPPTLDQDDPAPWKCGWSSRLSSVVGAYSEGLNHLRTCPYARIQRALEVVLDIQQVAWSMGDYERIDDAKEVALILRGQIGCKP